MGKNRKQRIRSAILDEYKKGNNWLDASEKIQKMFGFNNETCPTTIKLWYDKFYLGDESLENDPLKEEKKAAKAAKKVAAQPAPVSPITQVLNNETQAKMLFELKEQVDLLYRKINTQERCLKLTDRYVKSLTKSNNNCISPDSVMDQQKKAIDFKRNYRLLRRKCNKLQSKVEANNFYENFYSKLEAACKEEKKRKAREAKKKKTNTKTTTSKTGRKRGRPCTVKPVEKKRAKVSKEDREPADCEQCGRSFRNPERLDTHMKQVHKPAERHYCSFEGCEVNYLSKAHLTRHMRVAHPKENQEFPCTWADCTFVANSSATLAKHVNGHSGDPPYKCLWPDCDYACSLVSNLDKHTAMHERKQNLLMEIENENEIPEANQRFNDPATIINDPGPIDISKCQVPNVELVESLLIRNDQQQQLQQQQQQQHEEFVHSQQQQLQQQLQQQQQQQ